MSLLLEALKKAEKAKRANTSDASARAMSEMASGSSPGLTLEISPPPEFPSNIADDLPVDSAAAQRDALPSLTTPEDELSAKNQEQAFPEISLAEMEVPEPSPQETLIATPIEPGPQPSIAEQMGADRMEFAAIDFSAADTAAQPPAPAAEPIAEAVEATRPAPVNALEKRKEPALSLDFPEPAPPSSPQASEPPPRAMPAPATPHEPAPVQPDAAPVIATVAPAAAPAPTLPPTLPGATADTAKKQETAKNILAAKQHRPKRNFKRLGGILIVSMSIGAAGAYYYWQALDKLTPAPLPAQQAPLAVAPPEPQQPDAQPGNTDEVAPRHEPQESAAPPPN